VTSVGGPNGNAGDVRVANDLRKAMQQHAGVFRTQASMDEGVVKVKAIAALSESGATALWMSRLNCGVPVYALTPRPEAVTKMSLFRAVFPLFMSQRPTTRDELLYDAEKLLMNTGIVQKGDFIVLTSGDPMGTSGGTNTLKIVRVGDQQLYDHA